MPGVRARRTYGLSVDLSGIIFVGLAVAWAIYLVPKALKHHDEVARTRSIDRFSTAMRVLARREPVNRRDARLVVTPARPASSTRMLVPTTATSRTDAVEATAASAGTGAVGSADLTTSTVRRTQARRAAARVAARRRRRILLLLLTATLVVGGLAGFRYLLWWSVSIPAALTLLWLFLCRRQVRRANDAAWTATEVGSADGSAAGSAADPAAEQVDGSAEIVPRRAVRVEAPYGTPMTAARNDQGFAEVSADEDTVTISTVAVNAALAASSAAEADLAAARAVEVDSVAVSVATLDGGSLWDPLPVTLPTYVSKPRAARTVRTIDLSEPGTWSSGRSEADSKLVEDAESAEAAAEEAAAEAAEQRAVGS